MRFRSLAIGVDSRINPTPGKTAEIESVSGILRPEAHNDPMETGDRARLRSFGRRADAGMECDRPHDGGIYRL